MHERETFERFVQLLIRDGFSTMEHVEKACEHLDGYLGVLSDCAFTIGYEALARNLREQLDGSGRQVFLERYEETLCEDPGCQYYFVESFVDVEGIDDETRKRLISAAPERYQSYLFHRFFGAT